MCNTSIAVVTLFVLPLELMVSLSCSPKVPTIPPDSCSFMFSFTYKVAVNLLSPQMAFYSSCDLLHVLMLLYSNWLPEYFFCPLPEAAGVWLGKMVVWIPLAHLYRFTFIYSV